MDLCGPLQAVSGRQKSKRTNIFTAGLTWEEDYVANWTMSFSHLTATRCVSKTKGHKELVNFYCVNDLFYIGSPALIFSPGWILQCLKPQFVFGVECDDHFLSTQDLQPEREVPHTNQGTSWGPCEGDGVLVLSLHSQPDRWWAQRSTTGQPMLHHIL